MRVRCKKKKESRDPQPKPKVYEMENDPELPDMELFIHDSGSTIDPPSHYEPGAGVFHSSVHEPPTHEIVQTPSQSGARLPSAYNAVH